MTRLESTEPPEAERSPAEGPDGSQGVESEVGEMLASDPDRMDAGGGGGHE